MTAALSPNHVLKITEGNLIRSEQNEQSWKRIIDGHVTFNFLCIWNFCLSSMTHKHRIKIWLLGENNFFSRKLFILP